MQSMFRRIVATASLLAATVVALSTPGSAFSHEGHAALPSTGATVDGDQVLVSAGARKGLGLETATVTLADLERVLRVRASVELPWHGEAMVTTLVPGRVQTVLAGPGETVRAGQELARIESLELETLQLTMLQAAGQIGFSRRLVEQRRELVETGAIPGESLLEAETQLRQNRVQLALAERKLMALGLEEDVLQQVRASGEPIASISLTSPMGGVVVHSDARVGQFVDTEAHLFNIVDRSKVLVVGEVLETDAWQIERGQAVQVTVPALLDRSFTGSIARQRLTVDPQKRVIEVVVTIDNTDEQLRPGMSGRMEITTQRVEQAIVCPAAALVNTPGRTFVLVRRGEGKYERKEVRIGLRTPGRVEILSGLFPGDRVIVTGTKLLASMFHTDHQPSLPSQAAQASASATSRSEAIPVAQAAVELPTSRKSFATPVVAGRIVRIHVQPGDIVEAGQMLAELDSQELRHLQLELLESQEKLRRVTSVIDRIEPLTRSGGVPASELWEYQMQQKTLQFTLRNVERKLALVGLSPEAIQQLRRTDLSRSGMDVALANAPVRAPAAGWLADFDAVLGQIVHADDSLFEIQDLSTVWLQGYVFEQHASRVAIGQPADIRFPAYPELQLTGEVIRTAPTLHPGARVLPVWIEVDNPGQKLREGMLAEIVIHSTSPNGQIAVLPSQD